jgi:hypothetical protein
MTRQLILLHSSNAINDATFMHRFLRTPRSSCRTRCFMADGFALALVLQLRHACAASGYPSNGLGRIIVAVHLTQLPPIKIKTAGDAPQARRASEQVLSEVSEPLRNLSLVQPLIYAPYRSYFEVNNHVRRLEGLHVVVEQLARGRNLPLIPHQIAPPR